MKTLPLHSFFLFSTFSLALGCSSGSSSSTSTSTDGGADGASSGDSASNAGGGGCATLCQGAKFNGGTETDFGGGVVECVCDGTSSSGGIAKSACEAYCAPKGVAAAKAFLSKQASDNDKCVCDGT